MKIFRERKKLAALFLGTIIIALFITLYYREYMTLETLKSNRAVLQEFYYSHRIATVALFMVIYIVQSALALPGPLIMSLVAGTVFGVVMGTIYVDIAATIGASLAFLGSRYFFRDSIRKKYGEQLKKVNKQLESNWLRHLLFLRLVPMFPYTLINLAAGMTRMPFRIFFFGTMIGILPPSIVFCNAGASIGSVTNIKEIFSLRVIGSLTLLGFIALAPAIYRKLKKTTNEHSHHPFNT